MHTQIWLELLKPEVNLFYNNKFISCLTELTLPFPYIVNSIIPVLKYNVLNSENKRKFVSALSGNAELLSCKAGNCCAWNCSLPNIFFVSPLLHPCSCSFVHLQPSLYPLWRWEEMRRKSRCVHPVSCQRCSSYSFVLPTF